MKCKVINLMDKMGHKLHLPDWVMKPICDWYDIISCGITKQNLIQMDYVDRGKPVPWWLR